MAKSERRLDLGVAKGLMTGLAVKDPMDGARSTPITRSTAVRYKWRGDCRHLDPSRRVGHAIRESIRAERADFKEVPINVERVDSVGRVFHNAAQLDASLEERIVAGTRRLEHNHRAVRAKVFRQRCIQCIRAIKEEDGW
ncbi:hypothetical protein M5C95_19400 [Acidovorax sp. NCPPB 4044]|nr:hypothetical protein [Acidovorax sp. NCPPB 4044]MDA8522937.1 hypothetical protein [Acidovorax sp. NCPPB 4044]